MIASVEETFGTLQRMWMRRPASEWVKTSGTVARTFSSRSLAPTCTMVSSTIEAPSTFMRGDEAGDKHDEIQSDNSGGGLLLLENYLPFSNKASHKELSLRYEKRTETSHHFSISASSCVSKSLTCLGPCCLFRIHFCFRRPKVYRTCSLTRAT